MLTFSNAKILVANRVTSFYKGLVSSWLPWRRLVNVDSRHRRKLRLVFENVSLTCQNYA